MCKDNFAIQTLNRTSYLAPTGMISSVNKYVRGGIVLVSFGLKIKC